MEVDVFDKCMIMLEPCINKEIRSQNIYLPFHIAVICDLRKTFPWLNVAMGTSMYVEFFESRLGYDSPYKVALKWVRNKNDLENHFHVDPTHKTQFTQVNISSLK